MRARAALRVGALAVPTLLALVAGCAPRDPAPPLPLVAEPGPWPWVSALVAYDGRLWLASGEKGRDHNSADLYSVDPATGALRYERHLFSQGVGRPAVVDGLLWWPYEDPRFHLGVGLLAATDGRDWSLIPVPSGAINHTHAALGHAGGLVVAASSLRPLVASSPDRGRSWRPLFAPEGGARRVVRIPRLAALGDALFGALQDGLGQEVRRTLVRIGRGVAVPVPGWPEGDVLALETRGGWLFGVVREEEGHGGSLWRTDGARSERVGPGPPGRLRDLAVGGDGALYALTERRDGGRVWRSPDGRDWGAVAALEGGRPIELEMLGDAPWVGGHRAGGAGALWGRTGSAPAAEPGPPPPLPRPAPEALDWPAEGRALDALLADPTVYADRDSPLTAAVVRLARAGPPPDFFAARLAGPFPEGDVAVFEGRRQVPRARLGRWNLLLGMALAGSGDVPRAWLRAPWSAAPDPQHKYLEPLPGALAALSWGGRADRATLDALVARLGREDDPAWLTGDVVGALAAATGERHGWDRDAWRTWWSAARTDWDDAADRAPAPPR